MYWCGNRTLAAGCDAIGIPGTGGAPGAGGGIGAPGIGGGGGGPPGIAGGGGAPGIGGGGGAPGIAGGGGGGAPGIGGGGGAPGIVGGGGGGAPGIGEGNGAAAVFKTGVSGDVGGVKVAELSSLKLHLGHVNVCAIVVRNKRSESSRFSISVARCTSFSAVAHMLSRIDSLASIPNRC